MFENIPNTRVISETYSFLFVWNMYLRGEISFEEYQKLLCSTFNIQCKKERGIHRIVMKHNMAATSTLSSLKQAYPQIQLIFISRHPLPSLKSYDKLWNLIPVSGTIAFLANINDILWKNYPIPHDDVVWWERYREVIKEGCTLDQKIAMQRIFLFNYWCVVEQYIKNKNSYDQTILYEDLCDNPPQVLENLFSVLHISADNIPLALKVMEKDSQKGFFGKRGSYEDKNLTRIIELVDRKFKEYNVPIEINISMEDFRKILN